MPRKVAWGLSLALLLFTGVDGLYNGTTEWKTSVTPFQKSVTGGVLLYGIIGMVTAFGLFRHRRWAVTTSLVWAVIITYVPGAAVMAYGGQGAVWTSALVASAASAAIASGVTYTAFVFTRGERITGD